MNINISGFLNIFRLATRPSLFVPHLTVAAFSDLPSSLDQALQGDGPNKVDVRAVILDKDDCFARPGSTEIHPPYKERFADLRKTYPGRRLLVVSNTVGAASWDRDDSQALAIESSTDGVHVLRHREKKPACGEEIMAYFRKYPDTGVIAPSQVAVVGDRLATDVALANRMGAWAIWIREGVVPMREKSLFARIERPLAAFLVRRGVRPPEVARTSHFE